MRIQETYYFFYKVQHFSVSAGADVAVWERLGVEEREEQEEREEREEQ